jgi:KipI family sensor histidine kinase inhibitor
VTPGAPPVLPLGEAAWTVVLGDSVNAAVHQRVAELAARIEAAAIPGVIEIVPAYSAVTVFFDPPATDADALRERLSALAASDGPSGGPATGHPAVGRLITIPVVYDGPDLDHVARQTLLEREEVIRRHAGREYQVYLLGFAPGFAYLGELDPTLVLPRRSAPRPRVPKGTVAIAGSQTGVYPVVTPGGWHLIGTTPLVMFDPARDPAALLKVGDRVRFEPAE